jgi:hypothetical protein
VLLSSAVMSVLMHVLLQRVTHMGWRQMMSPLTPALACAFGVAVVVLAVEYSLRAALPRPNPWLLVFCQAPAAALFVAGFALFAPFRDLRDVVRELTETLIPKAVRQHRWAQAYLRAQAEEPREVKTA